jgi:hypothetical protein
MPPLLWNNKKNRLSYRTADFIFLVELEGLNTLLADQLFVMSSQPIGGTAKNTALFVFSQNNLFAFQPDLQLIILRNIQYATKFHREGDPAQAIYLAKDAC